MEGKFEIRQNPRVIRAMSSALEATRGAAFGGSVGLRLAVFVFAVVGPATGLEAHLPTRMLRCHRARAPVLSSQVEEAAASATEIDEEWFPAGAHLCGKQPPRGFCPLAPPAPDQAQGGLQPRPSGRGTTPLTPAGVSGEGREKTRTRKKQTWAY